MGTIDRYTDRNKTLVLNSKPIRSLARRDCRSSLVSNNTRYVWYRVFKLPAAETSKVNQSLTLIGGRTHGSNSNIMDTITPRTMPYSKPAVRDTMKVVNHGNRSLSMKDKHTACL